MVGDTAVKQHVVATQYPEMVFINDLLFKYHDFADLISEEKYLEVRPSR